MEIKVEIGEIASAAWAWIKDQRESLPTIERFAIRALDRDGSRVLSAMCSIETAGLIARGESIGWIQNTSFLDESPDALAQLARRDVDMIERGLRAMIRVVLISTYGARWADVVFSETELARLERIGADRDDEGTLLDYAYLLDLMALVADNWAAFSECFRDRSLFESDMKRLNRIRRAVAHSRNLPADQLDALNQLKERFLGAAAGVCPEAVPAYLTENWRRKWAATLEEMSEAFPQLDERDRTNLDVMYVKFEQYANALRAGATAIESLVIPPGKRDLHRLMHGHLSQASVAVDGMLQDVRAGEFKQLSEKSRVHETAMNALRDLKERIHLEAAE